MSGDRIASHERAAVIDAVASAIRHDALNKLCTIRNAAYYIKRKLEAEAANLSDQRIVGFLELIEESVASIEHLLTERMGYKLDANAERTRLRIGDCIPAALRAAKTAAPLQIGLQLEDRSEISVNKENVILLIRCLIDNAIEAMPNGGVLNIRTWDSPDVVMLSVEDNGPGLSIECEHHAFDAFYSTKPGRVGLGLCLVKRMAQRYGGIATIEGTSRGARVIVSFARNPPDAL